MTRSGCSRCPISVFTFADLAVHDGETGVHVHPILAFTMTRFVRSRSREIRRHEDVGVEHDNHGLRYHI